MYDKIIQQQVKNNVIEAVDVTKLITSKTKVYYLPHHPVLTPDKETTKICIVYYASARVGCDVSSLNECLLLGPIMLPDLCGLLRFRLYKILLLADVEKAFLQIGIQERERDVTRFLRLRDIHSVVSDPNLVVYRFCRVPFGLTCTCSPFLLGATLKFHLQKEGTSLALKIFVC